MIVTECRVPDADFKWGPEECRECLMFIPSSMRSGCPPMWNEKAWTCYRVRRNGFLNPGHQYSCQLNLPVKQHVQMTLDIICMLTCQKTIETKEQFESCFKSRCPVALQIEHLQFAVEMNFLGYQNALFRQLSAKSLHEKALAHKKTLDRAKREVGWRFDGDQ